MYVLSSLQHLIVIQIHVSQLIVVENLIKYYKTSVLRAVQIYGSGRLGVE